MLAGLAGAAVLLASAVLAGQLFPELGWRLTLAWSMGIPIEVGDGVVHPFSVGYSFAAGLLPLLSGFVVGGMVAVRVRGVSRSSRVARVLAAGGVAGALLTVAMYGGVATLGGIVEARPVQPWAAIVPALWIVLAGLVGLVAVRRLRPTTPPNRRSARRLSAIGVLVSLILGFAVIPIGGGAPEAVAEPVGTTTVSPTPKLARELSRYRATGELAEAVVSDDGRKASFLVVGSTKAESAKNWLRTHARLLQPLARSVTTVAGKAVTLKADGVVRSKGTVHRTYVQHVGKVPVYRSRVTVHHNDAGRVVAVTNGLATTLTVDSLKARVSRKAAVNEAGKAAPSGSRLTNRPWLAIKNGSLVWVVDRSGHAFANRYFVSAAQRASVLAVEERLREGLDRLVYDAKHTRDLPGTVVIREGGTYSASSDSGKAYVTAGQTWSYYHDVFGRDSFDDAGARLVSTVFYDKDYQNAYWDGSQMVFGDNMVTLDIMAHELTHAVTEWTADLEYLDQSGALNESFSDVFGVMARYHATGNLSWTIGGGSALGVIRDMSNPAAYGQPAHLDDYDATCDDHGGVHTNSGIPNKAFYNAVQKVGADKAQRIFYLALTAFLLSDSDFNDARAATIQAARQLYAGNSATADGIAAAWNDVGVDGSSEPPVAECGCSVNAALQDSTVGRDALSPAAEARIRSTLYKFRDGLLGVSGGGLAAALQAYRENTGELSDLLRAEPALRRQARQALVQLSPAIAALAEGRGDAGTVTDDMVTVVDRLRAAVVAKATARGMTSLAATADAALPRDLSNLSGKTFNVALDQVSDYWNTELHR
ncbi:MAG: M4 family metallopeptidase [Micropruina sp.]|uniref:M4 family metallopeptidase n=1 Tax=Micropruina sp. TaxID=2737536 RepID=UPI0039E6F448